jgi:uncharacterized protein YodC (DUF2158 family)
MGEGMATEFEVGDIVQLKSGGPKMTVTSLSTTGSNTVYTAWFAGSKRETGGFPGEALILIKDESTK